MQYIYICIAAVHYMFSITVAARIAVCCSRYSNVSRIDSAAATNGGNYNRTAQR